MAEIARLFPENEQDNELDERKAEALREATRIAEALIFVSSEPVDEKDIGKRMPEGVTALAALEALRAQYAGRGINLIRVNTRWTFRTASDLSWLLSREVSEPKKLSRPAIETLSIIAYHQPVTRAEIARNVFLTTQAVANIVAEAASEERACTGECTEEKEWLSISGIANLIGICSTSEMAKIDSSDFRPMSGH